MRESETTEAGLRASAEGSQPRAASFVAVPAYKRVLLGDGAGGDLGGGWGYFQFLRERQEVLK